MFTSQRVINIGLAVETRFPQPVVIHSALTTQAQSSPLRRILWQEEKEEKKTVFFRRFDFNVKTRSRVKWGESHEMDAVSKSYSLEQSLELPDEKVHLCDLLS